MLGDLRESVEADVIAVRKVVEKLVSGGSPTYTSADVNAATSLDIPELTSEERAAEMGLNPEDRVIPSDASAGE